MLSHKKLISLLLFVLGSNITSISPVFSMVVGLDEPPSSKRLSTSLSFESINRLNQIVSDENVSDIWKIKEKYDEKVGAYYIITHFPLNFGFSVLPDLKESITSLILYPYITGSLNKTLEGNKNFSFHFVFTKTGDFFGWFDLERKLTPSGGTKEPQTWNKEVSETKRNALNILIEVDIHKQMSDALMEKLQLFKDYMNQKKILSLKYLEFHSTTSDSEQRKLSEKLENFLGLKSPPQSFFELCCQPKIQKER